MTPVETGKEGRFFKMGKAGKLRNKKLLHFSNTTYIKSVHEMCTKIPHYLKSHTCQIIIGKGQGLAPRTTVYRGALQVCKVT
jgi:hypothetical protein